MTELFAFDGRRAKFDPFALSLPFAPNRSRRDWRELPFSVGPASRTLINSTTILPVNSGEFDLRGETSVDTEIGGKRYVRSAQLAKGVLQVTEDLISNGGEIAPEAFREERRKAAGLARKEGTVHADENLPRRWRFATSDDRSALQPLEDAFTRLIENDPDEPDTHLSRAGFRFSSYDFAGTLVDMDKVIELEPMANYYGQRSTVHSKMLNFEASIADLEEAYALDPSPWRAMHLARELMWTGEAARAREILEYEDGDEDVRQELEFHFADLDALDGDPEAGLWRLEDLLIEKPNNSGILNTKCWFMGTWQIEIEEGVSVCTKAVENSGKAAAILDSRAMVFLRNGMLEEALADANAALDLEPGQSATVLLRGIIRREMGDKGGQADIDDALARDPDMVMKYRIWGFDI